MFHFPFTPRLFTFRRVTLRDLLTYFIFESFWESAGKKQFALRIQKNLFRCFFFFFLWSKTGANSQFSRCITSKFVLITGQVSEPFRPTLTTLLSVNYLQVICVLNSASRSALLGCSQPISHQEIINQQILDPVPLTKAAFIPPTASFSFI